MNEKEQKRESFRNFDMNRNLDVVYEDPREQDRTTAKLDHSGENLASGFTSR